MNKLIIYILLGGITSINLYSQTASQNYIRTRSYTNEAGTAYLDQIQYFDGLGRPMQAVQQGITPKTADLVTYQEYDNFGREDKSWLPTVVSGNNGAYIPFANYKPKAIATYSDSAYSRPVYEASPLNRVLEQYGPGNVWYSGKKAVRTEYLTNVSNNDTLNCILYTVNDSNPLDSTVTISRSKNYDTGQLYVTRLADEDGNTSFEFKDKQGQVVLTRQIIRNGSSKNLHDTYYIYDGFGNQKAVLPPIASDAMKTGTSWSNKGTVSLLRDYAYLYEYDSRNRCVAKRIPGTHWVYYVYDTADRLIFTQDGVQRNRNVNEWTIMIYDILGRVVLTGIISSTNFSIDDSAGSGLPAEVLTSENIVECVSRGEVAFYARFMNNPDNYGYTWEVSSCAALENSQLTGDCIFSFSEKLKYFTINYYDNYAFMGKNGIPANTDINIKYNAETGYGVWYGADYTEANKYKNKGMFTGNLTAQMNSDGTIGSTFLYSVMYYDNRGRLIQTKSNNHLTGGIEKEYLAYNFTGQPIKKLHIHSATGKPNIKEEYAYTYDHAGRLLKTTHQLTEGTTVKPQVTLAENTYDELGRLQTHKANNQANLNTTYTYNIRSWTKSISSPLFSQTLYYNDKVALHNYSDYQPSYNGNISGMEWNVQAEAKRSYRFKYDNLSRLTHAAYNGVTDGGMYNTSYQYDKHGNIQDLVRRGKNASAADNNVVIDKLTMTYGGNQLVNVADAVANFAYGPSADFKDKVSPAGTIEYTYNANGAMTKDLNKGISNIAYNSLNLPRQMVINSATAKAKNYYTYSASGVKLKTEQRYDPNLSVMPVETTNPTNDGLADYKNTDYVGNIIYETVKSGSTITNKTRILVDGGYIEGGVYYFYLSDHLGNNRVVANATGTPIQKNHYYPFGTAFAEGTPQEQGKQPYKYNGKQLDDMHQLNLYDYSARYYESAVGRFTSVDPLAEKYYSVSPYAYVANNPINAIDINGDSITVTHRTGFLSFLGIGKKETVTYENGSLYNKDGTAYKGNVKGFLLKAANALDNLRNTTEGNALVSELQSSSHTFDIQKGSDNTFNPNSVARASGNINLPGSSLGSGGIIKWNPSSTSGAIDITGSTSRPAYIGLGHELIHGSDSNRGVLDYNMKDGIRMAEWNAVYRENLIRGEANIPLRSNYGLDISTGKPVGTGPNLFKDFLKRQNKRAGYPF